MPETGGPILLKLQPTEKKLFGVVFEGSRDRPIVGLPMKQILVLSSEARAKRRGDPLTQPNHQIRSMVAEYLRTNGKGEFVLLRGDSRNVWTGEPGTRVITFPWHTADGREVPFIWLFDLIQSYPLTNDGTFFEIDMSKVGTARFVLEGVEELVNAGYRFAGPITITDMRYRSGGPNLLKECSLMTRSFDVLKSRTADLLMFESSSVTEKQSTGSQPASAPARSRGATPVPVGTNPHPKELNSVTLQFVTSRPKEGSPDLVAETTYTRQFAFAVVGGRITEIPVPVNKLEEWQSSQPKWRRVETAATQTAPE